MVRYVQRVALFDDTLELHAHLQRAVVAAVRVHRTCPAAPSAIAYDYPNPPYRIHLWYRGYPNAGAPCSKGSILVHEASHFDIVPNTDDVTYGTTNPPNLAVSTPASAARNADNHHYFATREQWQLMPLPMV